MFIRAPRVILIRSNDRRLENAIAPRNAWNLDETENEIKPRRTAENPSTARSDYPFVERAGVARLTGFGEKFDGGKNSEKTKKKNNKYIITFSVRRVYGMTCATVRRLYAIIHWVQIARFRSRDIRAQHNGDRCPVKLNARTVIARTRVIITIAIVAVVIIVAILAPRVRLWLSDRRVRTPNRDVAKRQCRPRAISHVLLIAVGDRPLSDPIQDGTRGAAPPQTTRRPDDGRRAVPRRFSPARGGKTKKSSSYVCCRSARGRVRRQVSGRSSSWVAEPRHRERNRWRRVRKTVIILHTRTTRADRTITDDGPEPSTRLRVCARVPYGQISRESFQFSFVIKRVFWSVN